MRFLILSFLAMLLFASAAEAARRSVFGDNQGKTSLSEEDKAAARENEMIERLNAIEALLKQSQEQQARQLQLLEQQNQLLNQMYQIDAANYQQMQQLMPQPAYPQQPAQ